MNNIRVSYKDGLKHSPSSGWLMTKRYHHCISLENRLFHDRYAGIQTGYACSCDNNGKVWFGEIVNAVPTSLETPITSVEVIIKITFIQLHGL